MKVFNTDIIEIVTDEKKLNWWLIQGWWLQKISQYCPKKQKLRDGRVSTSRNDTHTLGRLLRACFNFKAEIETRTRKPFQCVHTATQFVLKCCGTLQKGLEDFPRNLSNTDSADRLPF